MWLKDSIPLNIISTEVEKFIAEVQIIADGQAKPFLFDTGAASSTIILDGQTRNYASLKQVESKGTSGIPTVAQVIQIQELCMGKHIFKKTQLKCTERSILGVDLISELIFEVDFKNQRLNILNELPNKDSILEIGILGAGHFTVPLSFDSSKVDALFDTGADTTVVDSEYIKNNSKLFAHVGSEDGFDTHGNRISSDVYKLARLEVGALKLENVEVAAFNFGGQLREKMEGSPMILGNNVIGKASWSFDLKLGQCCLRPFY